MKLFSAVAVLVAGTGGWASSAGRASQPVVTVCLNPGANASVLNRGKGVASQVLKQVGMRIEWRDDVRACAAAEHGLAVSVSLDTAADDHPGALAYAMPFQGTRIVLFYDRVQNAVRADSVPYLAGYVLAHEIGHMLQGVSRHAASGVMKPRWDAQDYADMQRMRLAFTEEDVRLIHNNLDRCSRPVPVE